MKRKRRIYPTYYSGSARPPKISGHYIVALRYRDCIKVGLTRQLLDYLAVRFAHEISPLDLHYIEPVTEHGHNRVYELTKIFERNPNAYRIKPGLRDMIMQQVDETIRLTRLRRDEAASWIEV